MQLHFEGLDLAGKSTLCRRLARQARGTWAIRHNALTVDNPVYDLADRLRKAGLPAETVGWLYHAALLLDLDRYQKSSTPTIQDSTILLRSLAFHRVQGNRALVDRLEELFDRHPRFDRSFVCVASHEVRLRRLAIRRKENLGPEDLLVRDEPARFFAMERVLVDYAERKWGATVLDTSRLEEQERLELVFRHLPELEQTSPAC
jgi:thymidylate kinase